MLTLRWSDESRDRWRRAVIVMAVLTIPAAVVATQLFVGYRTQGIHMPYIALLLIQLCHWEAWAIAGPVVWRLERRWPIVRPGRHTALLRHAGASILVAIFVLTLFLIGYHVLARLPVLEPWFRSVDRSIVDTVTFFTVTYFHVELLAYGGIVAVAHGVRATALLRERENERLRLEAQLTDARLRALRMQLQPHFLFNTLHTVGSMIMHLQNRRALELLAELGDLLRGTLAHRDTEVSPLREEISYLEKYLRIEEARFGDRLNIVWDIAPAALDWLVPPFILQPLVENAFRHGISQRTDDSTLSITASIEGRALRIAIYNDGPPLSEKSLETAAGYGLENVLERLRTRHPAATLELRNTLTGVVAFIVLPTD